MVALVQRHHLRRPIRCGVCDSNISFLLEYLSGLSVSLVLPACLILVFGMLCSSTSRRISSWHRTLFRRYVLYHRVRCLLAYSTHQLWRTCLFCTLAVLTATNEDCRISLVQVWCQCCWTVRSPLRRTSLILYTEIGARLDPSGIVAFAAYDVAEVTGLVPPPCYPQTHYSTESG